VVKLFNVIQQSQFSAAAAEEEAKINRGTGKPSLPAPSTVGRGKNKGKRKDNILGRAKEGEYFAWFILTRTRLFNCSLVAGVVDQDDFFNMLKSGGMVSKA